MVFLSLVIPAQAGVALQQRSWSSNLIWLLLDILGLKSQGSTRRARSGNFLRKPELPLSFGQRVTFFAVGSTLRLAEERKSFHCPSASG